MATPEQLWAPSDERVARAALTRFQRWLAAERGIRAADYEDLWRWSTTDIDAFWQSIVDFFQIRFEAPSDRVLADRSMPGAEWFPGARLSYAEHIFRGKNAGDMALQHASEARESGSWTWAELTDHTARIAAGLRDRGVQPGDRVAAYMPNIPETLAAFLACASVGAVWSSAAPEFGVRSVVDRFSQIEPKVLLAVDGYRYGGKDFDRSKAVAAIAAELPGQPQLVRFGYLDGSGWPTDFFDPSRPAPALEFAQLPFEHPLWVLYSSGTTGLPKPIVHGQGGILLEQMKTAHLHLDAHAGDRVFWFTTTGWMMWNFLVGVLLTDASIVLYDGNPGYPDAGALWDLAELTGTTCFGTSAAFISGCMKASIKPRIGRGLGALESVGSTGSPLSPQAFRWVYEEIGSDTWLFSTSGGSDLCTAFVGGNPLLPVYEGELQSRALGADVQAWDEAGRALIDEVGELVLCKPMPSMPLYLWNDHNDVRYRETYFSTYPGIWRHGDWIEITSRGTAIIHGRSDSTINRGGVRMGTSEIYSSVLALDDIIDALVVDIDQAGTDGWLVLFVVLGAGFELDDELRRRIARRIREDCSPRHVPNEVLAVPAVPRTLSGKVLEVPIKRLLNGMPAQQVVSRDSLANPDALDWFAEFAADRVRDLV